MLRRGQGQEAVDLVGLTVEGHIDHVLVTGLQLGQALVHVFGSSSSSISSSSNSSSIGRVVVVVVVAMGGIRVVALVGR